MDRRHRAYTYEGKDVMNNEVKALTKYNVEALLKIEKAQGRVEAAQTQMELACQELSSIIGMVPAWNKASKLHDQIKAFWYKLDALKRRAKPWELDGCAMKRVDEKGEK